ncbi:efflux RND transporter periplasmic adaptor subunit [Nibricoccus sp. IMCC34717]|uniref:efflux RND transporter periplasmic adaptor subunit n=1 Tax=Nibricoccus sp. IMCC34717 TaxID=3034021 RepID=UPI00384F20EE
MTSDPSALQKLKIDRTQTPRRNNSRTAWIVVVLGLALAAFTIWWWLQRPKPFVVQTAVATVSRGDSAPILLNASGYVTARRAATVSSKVTGKIVEVRIEEGQAVEAGQILATVDATNTEASLRLAEAQLASARTGADEVAANLDLAERSLRRSNQLVRQNVVATAEAERAESEAVALRARHQRMLSEIAVADRQVAIWRQQLDDTVIRAPFTGIVTTKNAQPGEIISPMSAGGGFTRTGICTVVDMASLEIEVDVNESYINRVSPGQGATAVLDSYPDWKIPARVIAIIPTADRQKASVRVRVGFVSLDPRILPDMAVKVAFEGTAEAGKPVSNISIPASAVRSREGRDVVFVVSSGRAEQRAVRVASRLGDTVTLLAGLTGPEVVILNPPAELADGSLIKLSP